MKSTRPDFRTAAKQKLAEDRDVLSAAVEGLLSVDPSRIAVRSVRLPEIHLRPNRASATAADETLDALAASIRGVGMLEPILVRPRTGGGFEVVAGERRWRAARIVGLANVPVVIREIDDATAEELAAAAQSRSAAIVAEPIVAEPIMAEAAARAGVGPAAVGVPVMSEGLRVEPRVSAPRPAATPAVRPAVEPAYGMPAPARSAAPNREPRVISGPGLSTHRERPTPSEPRQLPEFTLPSAVPIPSALPAVPRSIEATGDDAPRRRLGLGLLPRLRPLARRDRA